jgi:hypothetical protein
LPVSSGRYYIVRISYFAAIIMMTASISQPIVPRVQKRIMYTTGATCNDPQVKT